MGGVQAPREDAAKAVPTIEMPSTDTNKIVASRAEVADMFRPTTQMPPLFSDEHIPGAQRLECFAEGSAGALPVIRAPEQRPAVRTTLGVAPIAPARVRAPRRGREEVVATALIRRQRPANKLAAAAARWMTRLRRWLRRYLVI